MGIHDGLFSSNLRKSAGDVTFTRWKGIPVFKKRVRNVRNPQSDAQMRQRAKIKALSSIGSLALRAIRLGFKRLASGKSEYNVFSAQNISQVTGFPDLTATVNFPALQFSQGGLIGINGLGTPAVTGNDVSISWTAPAATAIDANDEVVFLALRKNRANAADVITNVDKTTGTATVTLPDIQAGDEIETYAFARNPSTGEVSNTFYGGMVTA
ncbi:MAG: DUF6266 family protein [Bacteroidota bacterium]